jgi:GrpB-like predicted nucleotidyltransferase (UPF0157 family)
VTIDVRDYDPAWPSLAEAATEELHAALPGLFVSIEHIGSTSVPGLAAKPVIDLMAAVAELDTVPDRAGPTLSGLGYRLVDVGMPGRLFYPRERDGRRTHHLHLVTVASWPTRSQRIFRDHLRAHPEDLARYAALKRQLATQTDSGDDYTRAKTDLIQEITDRARAARGLPSVPIWEG